MKYLICIPILLIISSCTNGFKPSRYIEYIEKNSRQYTTTIERNGFEIAVQYFPVEYYAAKELDANVSTNIDSTLEKYKNSIFFTVRIKSIDPAKDLSFITGNEGRQGYSKNVIENSFNKGTDIYLYTNADTIDAKGYQFERNWGLGNGDAFSVVFDKRDLKKNLKKYNLVVSNLSTLIGSVDVKLHKIVKKQAILLRG